MDLTRMPANHAHASDLEVGEKSTARFGSGVSLDRKKANDVTWRSCLIPLLILFCGLSGFDAWAISSIDDVIWSLDKSQQIEPLEENALGEGIDFHTGSLRFEHKDVSLQGIGPEISIVRSFETSTRRDKFWNHEEAFSDWTLEIPRITTYAQYGSSWPVASSTGLDRCSNFAAPAGGLGAPWWTGAQLVMPGEGTQELLRRASANGLTPTMSGSFPIVTTRHWMISCLPTTKNGVPGEAFLAVSPSGEKYWFDWIVTNTMNETWYYPEDLVGIEWSIGRVKAYALVSRIEDRFGNYVTFTYSGKKLTDITASDGRKVSITWVNVQSWISYIQTITAQPSSGQPRTWVYEYESEHPQGWLSQGNLRRVRRPDQSTWVFNLDRLTNACEPDPWNPALLACNPDMSGSVTSPSGVSGTFVMGLKQGWYRYGAPATGEEYYYDPGMSIPLSYLAQKTYSGPGIGSRVWQYDLCHGGTPAQCGGLAPATVGTSGLIVTQPDSSKIVYTTNNTWHSPLEGMLLRIDYGAIGGATGLVSAKKTELYTYAGYDAGPFPATIGIAPQAYTNHQQLERLRPLKTRQTIQDGTTFSWNVVEFDGYGRPSKVTASNSLGNTRTTTTTYENNTLKWVVGQIKSITEQSTGGVELSYSYDPVSALPVSESRFGKLLASMTYHADGTLSALLDGKNRATAFSQYKRGIPQRIQHADNAVTEQVVSDFGEVTQIIDPRGSTTIYGYDLMGRLQSIAYPTGDVQIWQPVSLSFVSLGTSELGLPAGTWRHRSIAGNLRASTYYDATWRPVLEEQLDMATGQAIYRRQTYDYRGNIVFQSYPSASSSASSGINYSYDALGRLRERRTTDNLVLETISYLSGHRRQVTDADGQVTTTTYQAFDQPEYSNAVRVDASENVTQIIARDVFGKITQVTQSGNWSGGFASAARTFEYDVHQRPCRRTDPERGSTVWGYDAANQVAWEARGQSGSGCLSSAPSGATLFSYHARGWKILDDYPGTGEDVSYGYDPAGNVTSVANAVATWTYTYNKRNLLESEQVTIDGRTRTFDPLYDGSGHVTSLTTPSNTISYAPDGWGRPTRLGSYVNGIQYYPNGLPSGYTLGNGLAYTQTLDSRLRPQVQDTRDGANSIQKFVYGYSASSQLVSIDDQVNNTDDLTATYDGLHRLKTASGLWGTYGYTYDTLNNIRARTGSNGLAYSYNSSTNRLSSISGSLSRTYGYNARGEITESSDKSFLLNTKGQIVAVVSGGAGAGGSPLPPASEWNAQEYDLQSGDFNGDGRTDLLYIAKNPAKSSGIILSNVAGVPGIVSQTWTSNHLGISWGSNNFTAVVADFNGDGRADILLQRNTSGDHFLLISDVNGNVTQKQTISDNALDIAWSADQHKIIAGDFNGDGNSDLLFQATKASGVHAVVLASASGQFISAPVQTWSDGYLGFKWSTPNAVLQSGDFNADGRADLLIQARPTIVLIDYDVPIPVPTYRPNTNGVVLSAGGVSLFVEAGVQRWSRTANGVDWSPMTATAVVGDFTGDGTADVLLQPKAAGRPAYLIAGSTAGAVFPSAGTQISSNVPVSAESARIVAGNFDGTGGAGIFLQGATASMGHSIAQAVATVVSASPYDPASVKAVTSVYAYDGNGRRIKTNNGGSVEYTLYSHAGAMTFVETGAEMTDHLALNGQILVELKRSGGTVTPTYLHPDLLGSPRMATNVAKTVLWREIYDPFGVKLNGVPDKVGYTGHAYDEGTSYTYMQARFYDAQVGRFLSTDPVDDDFNLYAYVGNDPLDKKDPSGKSCTESSGTYSCKVDQVPKNATTQQLKDIAKFEMRYTAAVNKLMSNPDRQATVKVPGQKAFTVTAGDVGKSLVKAEVRAAPGTPGGANTRGDLITLHDGILSQGNRTPQQLGSFQAMGITHEGIHWTGWGPLPDGTRSATGERSVFDPYSLGREPLRSGHQDPYNKAATELLWP